MNTEQLHFALIGAIGFYVLYVILRRIFKMFDVNLLQKEVADELAKEQRSRAKIALVKIEKDIANAKQIVANLERQKTDLLASIGDGTF